MAREEFEVVGIHFRVTPDTIAKMNELAPLEAIVRRQPDNPEDENAIQVILTEKPWKGFHIGYLRRTVAENFGPAMDSGFLSLTDAYVFGFDAKTGHATISFIVKKRMVEPKIGP